MFEYKVTMTLDHYYNSVKDANETTTRDFTIHANSAEEAANMIADAVLFVEREGDYPWESFYDNGGAIKQTWTIGFVRRIEVSAVDQEQEFLSITAKLNI